MLHQHRANWVQQGLLALQVHERPFFDHVAYVFESWDFDPAKCRPGAWACTGGIEQWRVLTFKRDPLTMPLVDLAAIIGHEAMHYGINPDGTLFQVEHECRDPLCSTAADMNADPIYRQHRALRARLHAKLTPPPVASPYVYAIQPQPRPPQGWSTEKKIVVGVAAVAAVFGAFWLGPKVIGALAAA
jgi:hypothetical protein